jgi:ectoine hydroxylase-related dioxygenase (phytanoyl-CoA dioxygenase family)
MNKKKKIRDYLKNGYCIIKLFKNSEIDFVKKIIVKKLQSLDEKKLLKNLSTRNLSNYHCLNIKDEDHKKILKTSTRFIKLNYSLNKSIKNLEILKLIMTETWGHEDASLYWVGSLKKQNIKSDVIGFRISRPNEIKNNDATGIHIDLHVGGKICKDNNALITLWIPVMGYSSKYSLNFSPKSHLINHPIKKFKKSKTVTNIFTDQYLKRFKFIRPNLKKGDAIIFHPNLLHGNSFNNGKRTRFSLEARVYNKRNMINWQGLQS